MAIKTIDLFAGIGGIRKGFEATGKFNSVFANDSDKFCKLTYDYNFDNTRLTLGDVRDLSVKNGEIPEYDFLLAGFPCQPFSVAGLKQGFDDHKGRGNLIDEIVRLLKEATNKHGKPVGFLLENVKSLVEHNGGATYAVIKHKLEDAGYSVDHRIYNTLNFGVPQSRQRVYIVGFRNEALMKSFDWPEPGPEASLKVRDILESHVDARHYYNGKPLYERIKDDVTNPDSVYLYRRTYVREHKNGYAPTLVASMGQGGHNIPIIKDSKGLRKLTPRECATLQGYYDLRIPPELSEVQIYKQIGNSVSVPVIHAIAKKISDALETKNNNHVLTGVKEAQYTA